MNHATFEVTSANFQSQVIDSSLPVLVEFTADWCPPCKMLAPIIHALADKYTGRLSVGTLDADLYPQYMQQFGVMGLPTTILFQNGQPVQRAVGYQPINRIEALITPHLQPESA